MLSEQAAPESRDAISSAAHLAKPNPWQAFWRTLIHFDRQKVEPVIAFRNTIGVVVPLLVGVAMGSPLGGIAVASGAMNVSYSDKPDHTSQQRARQMLIASFVTAFAVLVGGLIGRNNFTAISVATVWAFAAGMLVAIGTTEGDLGVTTVVMLVIFSAQPLTPERAINAGLLALGGGLIETILSLALWPVRRYEPERRVLGKLYLKLSTIANSSATTAEAAPGFRRKHRRPGSAFHARPGPHPRRRPLPLFIEPGGTQPPLPSNSGPFAASDASRTKGRSRNREFSTVSSKPRLTF